MKKYIIAKWDQNISNWKYVYWNYYYYSWTFNLDLAEKFDVSRVPEGYRDCDLFNCDHLQKSIHYHGLINSNNILE